MGAAVCSVVVAVAGMVGAWAGATGGTYGWRVVDVERAVVCSVVAVDAVMAGIGTEAVSGGRYCWKRGCGVGGRRRRAAVAGSWYVGMCVYCPSAVLMPGSVARSVRTDWQMVA